MHHIHRNVNPKIEATDPRTRPRGVPCSGSRTAGSVWGSPARTPRGSEGVSDPGDRDCGVIGQALFGLCRWGTAGGALFHTHEVVDDT